LAHIITIYLMCVFFITIGISIVINFFLEYNILSVDFNDINKKLFIVVEQYTMLSPINIWSQILLCLINLIIFLSFLGFSWLSDFVVKKCYNIWQVLWHLLLSVVAFMITVRLAYYSFGLEVLNQQWFNTFLSIITLIWLLSISHNFKTKIMLDQWWVPETPVAVSKGAKLKFMKHTNLIIDIFTCMLLIYSLSLNYVWYIILATGATGNYLISVLLFSKQLKQDASRLFIRILPSSS